MSDDWFEHLYAETAASGTEPPWNRDHPRPALQRWMEERRRDGNHAKRAIVVGCGLGADAEYVATKNYNTTAFDLSPTAIRLAREQHPDTNVDYQVADLLDLPKQWTRAFDLVVEVWNVQAIPDPPRTEAIHNISGLVAPGGTLIVVAIAREDDASDTEPGDGPPWFLNAATIAKFAHDGVTAVSIDRGPDLEAPTQRQAWLAEFARPAA